MTNWPPTSTRPDCQLIVQNARPATLGARFCFPAIAGPDEPSMASRGRFGFPL